MSNYPAGAEYDSSAPFNEVPNEPKKLEVDVTIHLYRTVTLETTDYTVEKEEDEDGHVSEKVTFNNVEEQVKDLIKTPEECAYGLTVYSKMTTEEVRNELNEWEVDCINYEYDD